MSNASTNREIKLQNLLSLRKKMSQTEINSEMIKIGKYLQDNNFKKIGPLVTATFSAESDKGQTILDMEILIPLDRKAEVGGEYSFKEVFHMVNAVYSSHEGNPVNLQSTYNDILSYIQQNKLQQITPGYNVYIKEMLPGMTPDDMVIDVYIGVNPSIL